MEGCLAAAWGFLIWASPILVIGKLAYLVGRWLARLFESRLGLGVPTVKVAPPKAKSSGERVESGILDPRSADITCFDPATKALLAKAPITPPGAVKGVVEAARAAQVEWSKSTYRQRRHLLRVMLKCVVNNQEAILASACQESGKTVVDAYLGEILTTCEKLRWTIQHGEEWLLPEVRTHSNAMLMNKRATLEFHPLGVIGAIVPWNYPFHNVMNPVVAALFTGNSIVIKVSEYAAHSVDFMEAMIGDCLRAAGAPSGLVKFVRGYGPTGEALVQSGVDKVIFVGSGGVGKHVMRAAADNLTPVVLELGGKDPFIICDDVADIPAIAQLGCRGCFQNMGQNCTGAERFIVYDKVYDAYCQEVVRIVKQMQMGNPLGEGTVDCGAIINEVQLGKIGEMVDKAVRQGAKLLVGGRKGVSGDGFFFSPTVLADVTTEMEIAQEEVFGPVMCISRVKGSGSAADELAIEMANDCCYGLGASVHSASAQRARSIGDRVKSGMLAVNDFAVNYLCQCLPFGGVGGSGFDRFAGPEGLRGLCLQRSVAEDIIPFGPFRNSIPPALQYPLADNARPFCKALVDLFYGSIPQRLGAIIVLAKEGNKPKPNPGGSPAAQQPSSKKVKKAS